MLFGALEEMIPQAQPQVLPDTRPPRYRMVVSNKDTSVVVVLKLISGMYSRICSTTSHLPMTSAVLNASTALAPQPFLKQHRPLDKVTEYPRN